MQRRLPTCVQEIASLEESLVLAERKLLVCRKLVLEAEVEMRRLTYFLNIVSEQMDRNEESGNRNLDTARELGREYSILEIETAQWMAIYGSRNRERDDVKAGIFLMYELRRQRIKVRRLWGVGPPGNTVHPSYPGPPTPSHRHPAAGAWLARLETPSLALCLLTSRHANPTPPPC